MNSHTLIKGVSVVATALAIALGGVGVVSPETGLVRVAAQASATAAFTVGQAVVVNADALNMRADASIDAEIVTTLQNGTWATVVDGPVTGGDYSWYQVEYDDDTGWVAAEYLVDAATGGSLTAGSTVIVNTEALNLRSAAGSSSEVVMILDGSTEGSVVSGPETADDMDWYQVDFDGTQGWVSRTYLAVPATEADATGTVTGVLATATAVATDDAI
ncbi:MAG: SH3 domain-containing protein [Thermomicrobiales bacterium]